MRAAVIAVFCLGVGAASPCALAQSPATPTPATPGPAPGDAARDAIMSPARPPADVAPPIGSAPGATAPPGPSDARPASPPASPATPPGRVQYSPAPAVDPARAQPQGPLSPSEVRELLDAATATAKATREAVDYQRVVPDILTQVLAKLDKLENKLDKIEDILRAQGRRR